MSVALVAAGASKTYSIPAASCCDLVSAQPSVSVGNIICNLCFVYHEKSSLTTKETANVRVLLLPNQNKLNLLSNTQAT